MSAVVRSIVTGVGSYLPANVVTNDDLSKFVDTTDAWIGATAKVHGLEVLTFNMADFRPMAIACRDPSTDLPPDRPC